MGCTKYLWAVWKDTTVSPNIIMSFDVAFAVRGR